MSEELTVAALIVTNFISWETRLYKADTRTLKSLKILPSAFTESTADELL